ncbi:unnamed protein product [Cladocopium goreaui]|uniref:Tyr recombinase domain-containing protein n=1 Tax=Cladocopium goreaui TaxID=2562237 RepID=A0A9P1BRD8_9DINO|nr:unnamed protein product [Cladocopium goreaui]
MAESAAPLGAKLRWSKFSGAYRQRLTEGGLALDLFLRRHKAPWRLVETESSQTVDELLESFVKDMHALGKSSSLRVAKHAVLFVQCIRPRLKRHLGATWSAIRSWEEQKPSGFRPPLPVALLAALVCQARKFAEKEVDRQRDLWFRLSALLMLGFFGLLRPGEMFKLHSRHVTLPNSLSLGGPFAVVMLEQFTVVHHPDAINWLSWLTLTSVKTRKALWPSSPNKFRVMFKELCEKLGINGMKLSPASLRAGGATWMMDEGMEISKIRFLGRWSNLRSLEHYLQVARAQQIALTLEPEAVRRLRSLLLKFSFMLTLPEHFAALVPKEHRVTSEVIEIPSSESGANWQAQFKKAVVLGGSLKGAPYLEVSWEDLRKAAKNYKADDCAGASPSS